MKYRVHWPFSLIVSPQASNLYIMLFRHLFMCKVVERKLCETWRAHRDTKFLMWGETSERVEGGAQELVLSYVAAHVERLSSPISRLTTNDLPHGHTAHDGGLPLSPFRPAPTRVP